MRRSYLGRRQGSLTDLAEAIYDMIRRDDENLTRTLNPNKRSTAIRKLTRKRRRRIQRLKHEAEQDLQARIDTRLLHPNAARLEGLRVPAE